LAQAFSCGSLGLHLYDKAALWHCSEAARHSMTPNGQIPMVTAQALQHSQPGPYSPGSQPAQEVQLPEMQAVVVGLPSTMVKVSVPSGAVPGQQINFQMPCGLRVTTMVQEHVQPGAMLTVAVPSQSATPMGGPGHALPYSPIASPEEVDRQAADRSWVIFALSFPACCCFSPLIALLMWAGLAMFYFCKPAEERQRRPRQFAPACAAASTAAACGLCTLLGLLIFAVVVAACGSTVEGNTCPGLHFNMTNLGVHHHDWHHNWHHHWHQRFTTMSPSWATEELMTTESPGGFERLQPIEEDAPFPPPPPPPVKPELMDPHSEGRFFANFFRREHSKEGSDEGHTGFLKNFKFKAHTLFT